MSDPFWQDDQNQQNETPGMKSLREAYDKLKGTNSELTERLAALETDARKRTVASFLPAGVNPKVADFIPSTVEAKAESVKAWLEQYADVFTPTSNPPGEPGENPAGDPPATGNLPELPAEWVAAMQRISGGETGAAEMTRFAGELERAKKVADEVGSFDEFRRAMGA